MFGTEIVYDFATMERQHFIYLGGGLSSSMLGVYGSASAGVVDGFRSWRTDGITRDYSGPFLTYAIGASTSVLPQPIAVGGGAGGFIGELDPSIRGYNWYIGASAGMGFPKWPGRG